MEEVRKRIIKQTQERKKEISAGVTEKIVFYECVHVKDGELPARVNLYIGSQKRVLLCKVCCHLAFSTLEEFFETEYKRDELDELIGKAQKSLSEIQKKYPSGKWWQFWRK